MDFKKIQRQIKNRTKKQGENQKSEGIFIEIKRATEKNHEKRGKREAERQNEPLC